MKNRAQCSLLFPDDEVFENLVIPLKEGRILNEFIVKLVTMYYKNEQIRSIVDEGIETDDKEAEQKRSEMYSAINESLAFMEYLADEGKNVVEDGASMLESVLAGAEESGMATHEESDFGDGFTKFNIEVPKLETVGGKSSETTKEPTGSDRVSKLENEVSGIKDMLLQLQRSIADLGNINSKPEASVQEVEKISNVPTEVPVPTPSLSTTDDFSSDFESSPEVEVQKESDATDDMLALLGSI